MSRERPHQIYDYLLARYSQIGFQAYDPMQATKITDFQRRLTRENDAETALAVGELIYSIIYHHEILNTTGCSFRSRAYDGRIIGHGKGLQYEVNKMPVALIQMLYILIDELANGTFPFYTQL